MPRLARWILAALLLLNGLFFACNLYVLGDPAAAIAMHEDLSPAAAPFVAELKVVVTELAGILYLLGAVGFLRRRPALAVHAAWGAAPFLALYAYELAAWGRSWPAVWLGFAVFGGLALVFLVAGWREARRDVVPSAA